MLPGKLCNRILCQCQAIIIPRMRATVISPTIVLNPFVICVYFQFLQQCNIVLEHGTWNTLDFAIGTKCYALVTFRAREIAKLCILPWWAKLEIFMVDLIFSQWTKLQDSLLYYAFKCQLYIFVIIVSLKICKEGYSIFFYSTTNWTYPIRLTFLIMFCR